MNEERTKMCDELRRINDSLKLLDIVMEDIDSVELPLGDRERAVQRRKALQIQRQILWDKLSSPAIYLKKELEYELSEISHAKGRLLDFLNKQGLGTVSAYHSDLVKAQFLALETLCEVLELRIADLKRGE